VHQVGVIGRMVLQGAYGTLFKEHLENCAPCHNPNIDLTVDPTLTTVPADHPCQVCRSPGDPERMLLCDYCLDGWHMGCLEPVLTSVPAGIWLCPHCVEAERARQQELAWATGTLASEWGGEQIGQFRRRRRARSFLMANRQRACGGHVSGQGLGSPNFGLLRQWWRERSAGPDEDRQ
jgi:hypothetical protein